MRNRFVLSVAIADLGLLALSTVIASMVVFDAPIPWQVDFPGLQTGSDIVPLVLLLFAGAVLASVVTAGANGPGVPRPTYGRGLAIVVGTFAFVAITVLGFRLFYPRVFLAVTIGIWGALTVGHRMLRRARPWTETLAVVSSEKQLIADLVESAHVTLYTVIDPQSETVPDPMPPTVTLAVDLRAMLTDRVARFVSSCDIAGYAIRPLATVYEEHTGRIPLVHLAEGWEISTPLVRTSPFLPGKRIFDLGVVLLTLPIWLPLMAVVAATVRLSSPGPVFFRQRRIGLNGRPFMLVKFRTMRADSESGGPRMARANDDRIVRGGRLLRRSRLDELPQMWNVLVGDMSIVGPRAEQVPFVRQFRKRIPFYDQRHLVRPGITGWAQVNFGYAEGAADTVEKLSYDLYYVKHVSPILDVQILWKTIWTVLTAAGR